MLFFTRTFYFTLLDCSKQIIFFFFILEEINSNTWAKQIENKGENNHDSRHFCMENVELLE